MHMRTLQNRSMSLEQPRVTYIVPRRTFSSAHAVTRPSEYLNRGPTGSARGMDIEWPLSSRLSQQAAVLSTRHFTVARLRV